MNTDSFKSLFEMIPEACTAEFLQEAGFFYLIWMVKYLINRVRLINVFIDKHSCEKPIFV